MSGQLTLWGAGQLLTTYVAGTTNRLDNFYVALIMNVAPTAYVSGDELDEPVGMGYSRVAIPCDGAYWHNDVQPQVIATERDTSFNTATADWGWIRYWAITDAITGGNCFAVGSMESAQTVNNGDTPVISSGDISITLGPFFTDGS